MLFLLKEAAAFGQPWQFKDERQNVTNLVYWPWGPMKKQAQVITYRAKDGGGTETQPTDFEFDGLGRPIRTRFPDATTEMSDYDCGQLAAWKTRRNQTKRLSYDAWGREDYHTWDGGAAPGIDREWDPANRLLWLQNSFSKIEYSYDQAGQVRTEGTTVTGSGGLRQLTYDRYPTGEVSRLTYPNGTVVDRNYTGRGQLQGVGWGAGSTSYAYHPDGKVDYQARTNGVTTRYGYDGRGMISSVLHEKSDQTLASREYWRDNRDRIVGWKRGTVNVPNGMETGRGDRYAYDAEGQLTQASYRALNPEPWLTLSDAKRSDSFQYDALGNRYGAAQVASRGPMTFTRRDNGLNQYSMWSPFSGLFYDDNFNANWQFPGNGVMMADGYITASYNALNQPVAMGSQGLGSNFYWFWHDPLGRCVKRWRGNGSGGPAGPITYLYYDGWGLVQEGPNASTADRLYVHGGRVDEIVASKLGGQWYHHQYDARGHCLLLTNSGGAIQEQYDYDAFGMPYIYNAAGTSLGNSGGVGNRFLFTGREWIKDLRVYDYRNRVYQPELGRFLQPDPIQFKSGDYNLYRYCHNDPVNRNDPFGLDPVVVSPEANALALKRDVQNLAATNNKVIFGIFRVWEFSSTVFRDTQGNLSLSKPRTNEHSRQVLPTEDPNRTSVVETHSHTFNTTNFFTGSTLSREDVTRGNQTGRTQQAISPDGTRDRYRPSDDDTERKVGTGGIIERYYNGEWKRLSGANTDLKRPGAGRN